MKVKVKVKVSPETIKNYGQPKAFCKIAVEAGNWYDVAVHRYKGKYYFLVCHNGKLEECMPL